MKKLCRKLFAFCLSLALLAIYQVNLTLAQTGTGKIPTKKRKVVKKTKQKSKAKPKLKPKVLKRTRRSRKKSKPKRKLLSKPKAKSKTKPKLTEKTNPKQDNSYVTIPKPKPKPVSKPKPKPRVYIPPKDEDIEPLFKQRRSQRILSDFRSEGLRRSEKINIDLLKDDKKKLILFLLEAGKDYSFLGVCDANCTNLDLIAFEGFQEKDKYKIAWDKRDDSFPFIRIENKKSRIVMIKVKMVTCNIEPCKFALTVYSK